MPLERRRLLEQVDVTHVGWPARGRAAHVVQAGGPLFRLPAGEQQAHFGLIANLQVEGLIKCIATITMNTH